MKPIEETHPSLKGKEYEYCRECDLFSREDIQEHTIDKEKVREAIASTKVHIIIGWVINPDELLKRLGL